MKMNKLFIMLFDEELKSQGFKRKAKLYYRLNGDILQGVVIKTINPYDIHFYSAPFWMDSIPIYLNPLYKGYWLEDSMIISPDIDAYYREENEQFNMDYMNVCFLLAKKHILPIMDKMHDLDSYLKYCTPNWDNMCSEKAKKRFLKILPGEVDEKYSYLNNSTVKMLYHLWSELYTYSAFLKYGCEKGDLQKGFDLLEEKSKLLDSCTNTNRSAQKNYMEYMTEDGLERAKQYFEERRRIMLPRLRDELGLSVFNL